MSRAAAVGPSTFAGLATWLLPLSLACLSAPAAAHEPGLTQVQVELHRDGSYRIEIPIEEEPMRRKLELAAGSLRLARLTRPELRQRIEELRETFLDQVRIEFDGVPVQPDFACVEEDPGPDTVLRLTGSIPAGARTFRWSYGLPYTRYALQVESDGHPAPITSWVEPDSLSEPFELRQLQPTSRSAVARQYLVLGFTHILPRGLDHILFVLGIFLLSVELRPVLLQVTAFTVAHSITLGLSIYGVVSLPSSIVEPLIALSIIYVAVENLLVTRLSRWRIAVVFGFGLLHGLGFAGVLRELGLPRSEFVTALVTFNLGVEAGQLAVIGLAYVALVSWSSRRNWYRRAVLMPASLLIAATGLYWTIERLL